MKNVLQIFYQIIGLLSIMISCTNADYWRLPTAIDIQRSLENCKISDTFLTTVHESSPEDKTYVSSDANEDNGNIRCMAMELGLWNDHKGFNAKRLAKMLSKHQRNSEIHLVVTYCNDLKKQDQLNKWAAESYQCFARGRLGLWIIKYIENVFKEKSYKNY